VGGEGILKRRSKHQALRHEAGWDTGASAVDLSVLGILGAIEDNAESTVVLGHRGKMS